VPPVPLTQLIAEATGDVPDISITRQEYLDALGRLEGVVDVPEDKEAWYDVRFYEVDRSFRRIRKIDVV